MPNYQLTGEGYVLKDGNIKVPISTLAENKNPDYLEYLQWLDAGNTPLPAPDKELTNCFLRDWEFRDRFTPTQLVGIMRAAMAGDDISAVVWLKLSTASDGVDLKNKETIQGVQYIAATYPDLKIDPEVILRF